jgi:hypothetical protein
MEGRKVHVRRFTAPYLTTTDNELYYRNEGGDVLDYDTEALTAVIRADADREAAKERYNSIQEHHR